MFAIACERACLPTSVVLCSARDIFGTDVLEGTKNPCRDHGSFGTHQSEMVLRDQHPEYTEAVR
jgi:hypothetical protein